MTKKDLESALDENCCSTDSICIENLNCESSVCEGFSEVFQLTHDIDKKFNKMQEKFVLTRTQILILQELWKRDAQQLKELANTSNSSRANITGVIKTMEKKGFVIREKNNKDGRSYLIKITKKGQKLKNDVPSVDVMMNDCCKNVTQDEINILRILLKKFHDSLP